MVAAGKLGQVTMVRAFTNRNTASGAWIYPIPPDASPQTVDWDLFLGSAPKLAYDEARFFRWRCFKDYSGGISTDLFVHTCTTINYIMSADMCTSVAAMGGLYRWKNTRDVPDTINASLRYPEGFMVALSGTANNEGGGGSGLQILGTEGTLILKNDLTFIPENVTEGNGWIVESWPENFQEAYYEDPAILHEEQPSSRDPRILERSEVYSAEGTDSIRIHMQEFFDAVRNGTATKEDATVGHHAAACAHMINQAIDAERTVHWDPNNDTLASE
jgi:predicted dehydrogenase